MSAGKDGLIERYWAFANSGIRCVGIGSTITEARNNVIFSTIEDNDDAIVDDYAARLNAQAAQIIALEADKADKAALVEAHEIIMGLVKATEWGPNDVCDNEDKRCFYEIRDRARQWLVDVADATLAKHS